MSLLFYPDPAGRLTFAQFHDNTVIYDEIN